MARTRLSSKRRKTAALELALLDADILASLVPYLDARDLANLSMTCRTIGLGNRGGHGGDASLSLVQEAARRAILKEQTKTERAALVRYTGESWISVYDRLLLLRVPLTFDLLVGKGLAYEDDGDKSRAIISDPSLSAQSAISNHIMRGGKHFAEFSVAQGHDVLAGLMRPIPSRCWEKLGELGRFPPAYPPSDLKLEILKGRSERWGGSNIDCFMYSFNNGCCVCRNLEENQPTRRDWEGQESIRSGVLGLLLDLDAGTLTAYKDGRRLGVMCRGLAGEYCWVVSIYRAGGISIERGAIPDDA